MPRDYLALRRYWGDGGGGTCVPETSGTRVPPAGRRRTGAAPHASRAERKSGIQKTPFVNRRHPSIGRRGPLIYWLGFGDLGSDSGTAVPGFGEPCVSAGQILLVV